MYQMDKQGPGTSLAVQWLRIYLPVQKAPVHSLVRELRSHMPCGMAKKQNKQTKKSEVLLYSTDNYTQYPTINQNGKEYEKESMYV